MTAINEGGSHTSPRLARSRSQGESLDQDAAAQFDNKRDLFEKLLAETMGRFGAALQPADRVRVETLEESEAQLRGIGEALNGAFAGHPHGLQLVVQAEKLDSEMNARFRLGMGAFAQLSAMRIRNGVERGSSSRTCTSMPRPS